MSKVVVARKGRVSRNSASIRLGEDLHLSEHDEGGFKKAVERKESIGKHHPANDGATHVAFIPLLAGESGGHGEVALEKRFEAIYPLATAGIHFVRHRA